MDIEEIKTDLEEIARIGREHYEAFGAIKIEQFSGHEAFDKMIRARQAVESETYAKTRKIEEKYRDIINKSGICFSPPYDSSGIDDFLKFFLALYDEVNRCENS